MRKRNGTILCVLLALVALTFAAVLPASAADDTLVIGVYYYDADGNLITEVYGTPLNPPYFGYNLTHAQVAFDDIAHLTALTGAARTEVRLFTDVTTALTVPAGTTATLNLNGFTLSTAGATAPLTVAAGGTLTVTDTSADKSGSIAYTGSAAVSAIDNRGKLTVETANVTTASTAALISPFWAATLAQTARATFPMPTARASRSRAASSPKRCSTNTVRRAMRL